MNTKDRPKVEAILPLTFMQNALLFHSLSAGDDQGFIHVKLDIHGALDVQKLQNAWIHLVERHDAFRSSIHWEKIKNPVQVIHLKANHAWNFEDLRPEATDVQTKRIEKFIEEDKAIGFDFTKASISRVTIFQLSGDHHLLIWSCHHLLLDGWSSANVIRELSELYHGSEVDVPFSMPPLPSTRDYRNDWKVNDMDAAKNFWSDYISGFDEPSLVSKFSNQTDTKQSYLSKHFSIGDEAFHNLVSFSKQSKLTITSVLQMAWSIVLSSLVNSNDILFGNITSVRSPRLKNADLMCGLFTNMLPVRVQIAPEDTPTSLGQKIQQKQGKTRDFAYASLDDLNQWADWPGYLPLFDHIFVVENFPWKDIDLGDVKFSDFRSGITSSYPLTVVAKIDGSLTLDFIYDQSKISEDLVNVLGNNISQVLSLVGMDSESRVEEISKQLFSPVTLESLDNNFDKKRQGRADNYQIDQPSNPTELALTGIWENLFMRDGIGVHDNFFDIGGKSLLAVRLFQNIQKELDVNAPPIMILQYPTIAKLAAYISGDEAGLKWKSLVPLRVKGEKKPLFCLHAKGGYVFFYNKFTSYLDKDQPVYALQPRGLNGEDPMYGSIEEMASHYIQEIKMIQPEGPYNILATCFSNAVGLEMAQQLQSAGDKIGHLFMVDAAPGSGPQEGIVNKGALSKVNAKIKTSSVYNKSKRIYQKLKTGGSVSVEEEDFSVKHEKHLEEIFKNYKRQRYNGRIVLVRSTEFENLKRKDFHVEDWLKIVSEDNLDVLTVEGHHKTLFLEPEVKNLAEAFNSHMV